ncbi:MAG: alcohol dehydrogenase family protein [Desulfopila sp.]|jgi:NADPH:quinone reductase-like Zn-dependent oxidoreductase|nr:alcohol dehydrogenase family protein [Desulfopila sp.]
MTAQWDRNPRQDRFDPEEHEKTMKAVVTAGTGGYETLECRVVRRPRLKPGEILLQVLAAGVNNTEINTRVGWYSAAVTTATADAALNEEKRTLPADGGWSGATPFPLIQGTDCCGRVTAVAPGGDTSIIGSRVLVRSCMRKSGFSSMDTVWMGSDFDGAFAQFVKVPASEAFTVDCSWSDAELATIPCAYGTAENMIARGNIRAGEHVLVSGASGGVGSAVVQLAKRKGASVTAITTRSKSDQLRALGADHVLDRAENIVKALGGTSLDAVFDNVAGPAFSDWLRVLKRGGRYITSGAIGGPLVSLDLRTCYLKDVQLIGCTAWDEPVFPSLISSIELGAIQPLVAKTYPLERIADAQREFLQKTHVGNFVLLPPPLKH